MPNETLKIRNEEEAQSSRFPGNNHETTNFSFSAVFFFFIELRVY